MKSSSLPVVLATLLLVGAGCSFGLSGKDKSSVEAQPAPAPQASAGAEVAMKVGLCPYDDKTLCKFLTNGKISANMSMRTKSVVDGKRTESAFETDGKESSRMTYSENGKDAYATVTIGRAMYSKQANEKVWTKTVFLDQKADGHPPGDAEGTVKYDFTSEKDADAEMQTYVAMGKEPCGKLNCFKYEVTVKGSGEKQHVWFDDKEYRLRRILDFARDGMTSDTEFSYDAVIITEPSPFQEIDLGKMMGGSLENQETIEAQLKALQGQMPTE